MVPYLVKIISTEYVDAAEAQKPQTTEWARKISSLDTCLGEKANASALGSLTQKMEAQAEVRYERKVDIDLFI